MLAFFCSSLPNHHHVAFYLEVTIHPVNFPVIFATSNQALHLPLKRITSENKLIINIYPFVLSLPFNRVKSNFEQYIAYGGFPSWTHQQSPDVFICLLVIQLFGRGKRSKSHFNMADVCLCTEFVCLLLCQGVQGHYERNALGAEVVGFSQERKRRPSRENTKK